ncbi:unnamed protein product [Laminaria digitata]
MLVMLVIRCTTRTVVVYYSSRTFSRMPLFLYLISLFFLQSPSFPCVTVTGCACNLRVVFSAVAVCAESSVVSYVGLRPDLSFFPLFLFLICQFCGFMALTKP